MAKHLTISESWVISVCNWLLSTCIMQFWRRSCLSIKKKNKTDQITHYPPIPEELCNHSHLSATSNLLMWLRKLYSKFMTSWYALRTLNWRCLERPQITLSLSFLSAVRSLPSNKPQKPDSVLMVSYRNWNLPSSD